MWTRWIEQMAGKVDARGCKQQLGWPTFLTKQAKAHFGEGL